jgi:RHS repeat-associated protein
MRPLSYRNNGKITMRSLHAIAVLMLLTIIAPLHAARRITVGPGTGWDYNDINTAVTAQLPFTEDIILEVYVGPGGFTTPVTVEQNTLFAGYTLTISAVTSFPKTTTFYVGDEIEYELPQDQTLDCRVTEYVSGGDVLARLVKQGSSPGSGNQFYVKNHLGSTMFLVSADGNTRVAHQDYFPYGKKVALGTSPEYTSKTFTGKELDRYDEDMAEGEDGEGWYYFGARYYDGDVGRWVSTDKKREFWDLYRYTSNPLNFIDPSGLEEVEVHMFFRQGDPLINRNKVARKLKSLSRNLGRKYGKENVNLNTETTVATAAKGLNESRIFILVAHGNYTRDGEPLPGIWVSDNKFVVSSESVNYKNENPDQIIILLSCGRGDEVIRRYWKEVTGKDIVAPNDVIREDQILRFLSKRGIKGNDNMDGAIKLKGSVYDIVE